MHVVRSSSGFCFGISIALLEAFLDAAVLVRTWVNTVSSIRKVPLVLSNTLRTKGVQSRSPDARSFWRSASAGSTS